MPRLTAPGDVARYLAANEWTPDDALGFVRLWRHPGYSGKRYVTTLEALSLTLCERLENRKLRERIQELKAKRKA